jgi:versiconal hemiacetal acetate esterase
MPLAQSWIHFEKASGGRITPSGTPEEIRATYQAMLDASLQQRPPPSPNVEARDGEVNGIKYRLYWPKDADRSLPTAIFSMIFQRVVSLVSWPLPSVHCGAMTVGDLDTEDSTCRDVAEHTRSAVVSVDYRLAPEFEWPTQLEDCLTVYNWVSHPLRMPVLKHL